MAALFSGGAKCLLLLVVPASAVASSLAADGDWSEFLVGGSGDVWRSPLDLEPISFALEASSPFVLRVVDLGFAGDTVQVFSGATLLGTTAPVAVDDTVFAFTADEALASPSVWSQGQWLLDPGSYTFSGFATASPFGGANWAISALAVPEVASWAMLLAGLGVVGALARGRAA